MFVNEPYWQDVFTKLLDKGTKVTHVLAKLPPDISCATYFLRNDVKAVDSSRFFKLEEIAGLTAQCRQVLDKKTLEYFEGVERDYYITTDRYNYFPRSFRYRKRLFRESLRFWLAYLEREDIKLVFASCTPHDMPSFVCYHAAKFLNIPTLHFGHTMINDYVLPVTDYRIGEKVGENFMSGMDEKEIVSAIAPQLLERAFSASRFIEFSKFLNKESIKGGVKYRIKDSELDIRENVAALKDKEELKGIESLGLSDFKLRSNLLFMDKKVPQKIRKLIKKYEFRRMRKLREKYLELCARPDLSRKYIYYSMHMQPERTATPEAEIFEDQLMAVEILAKSVPENWLVYVKEHPSQFHMKMNFLRSRNKRDIMDYQDLVRYENVRLIKDDYPSAELVDNAQVVATLSGSVGWETLKKGKGMIVFAHAWYEACRSVYKVNNVNECKNAIEKITDTSAETVNLDLLKYLAYMQDIFIIGNQGEEASVETMTLPYKLHVDSVADYIHEFATASGKLKHYGLKAA